MIPIPVLLPLRFFAAGCTPRTSPTALREHLSVGDGQVAPLLERLRAAGIPQAMVLSTCDRVEIVGCAPEPDGAASAALAFLAEIAGMPGEALSAYAHRMTDATALRHVFGVAAALESVVVGEPQVLGQVKAAHRVAQEHGLAGRDLEAALQAAYAVAKRVRSETAIGERPVTLATSALRVSRDLFGEPGRTRAVLIGTGEMGEMLGERLMLAGVQRLTVMHAVAARAEALARRLGCNHAPLPETVATLGEALAGADLVLSALGTGRSTLSPEVVDTALKRRRRKPMLILDLAVPRDVEPAVGELDAAFLYDLDDLERVAAEGRAHREDAARAAWALVDAAVEGFVAGRGPRPGLAAARALEAHFRAERDRVLADLGARGNAEEATRLLLGRLLHLPLSRLGDRALDPAHAAALGGSLAEAFGFDIGPAQATDQDPAP